MILALFDPPSDFEQRVRGIAPDARVVRSRREAAGFDEALAQAEIIIGRPEVADVARAPHLTWVQLSSAGADQYVGTVREEVVITAANGVYGVPTAEHALAMMLAMVRGLHTAVRDAEDRTWRRPLQYDELYGSTCGVLGFGDIGSTIARRAKAFGMRVVALRRSPDNPPEYVDAMYGQDGLRELLTESDHVVNALPATDATHHLLNAVRLSQMKSSAILYNVGRGSTVDERALIDALRDGKLAGAALDVFEEEPLPAGSPLWEMPNVIITPHRGGSSPREDERVADLFLDNLARRRSGKPLRNVIDRDLGY